MLRALSASILLATSLFAPAAPAAGDDPASPVLARIVQRGELRIGMSGTQPPFNVLDKQGELMGLEVDLAKILAGTMRVEARFVQKPFGELLSALEAGEVDLVMSGMTITPERNMRVAFVGPYYVSGKSVLTKSATIAAATNTDDIDRPSLKIAALEGSTSQEFVEELLKKATLVKTPDYDTAIEKIRKGEADALVADFPICALSALRYPDDKMVTLTKPLTVEPIGIALPPNDALFVNLVENYLAAIEATGMLELTRKKWFEEPSWLIRLP